MRLTRRNGIFSADQGASISPRGKQLHFGGKQAAGVNGGPRTAPDGWEEAPPGPPGGLLIAWQICRHCRVVMAGAGGKRRPRREGGQAPPGPCRFAWRTQLWGRGPHSSSSRNPGSAPAVQEPRAVATLYGHMRGASEAVPIRTAPSCRPRLFPLRSLHPMFPRHWPAWPGGGRLVGGAPLSTSPSLAQGHRAGGRKQPAQPPTCSLKSRSVQLHPLSPPPM